MMVVHGHVNRHRLHENYSLDSNDDSHIFIHNEHTNTVYFSCDVDNARKTEGYGG